VRPRFQASPVAEAAQAIADRVVQSARLEAKPSGRLEFVVEMRPEVLGGLEVRVRFEGGQVHAVFGAAAPEVRAVLEAQCHALRGALQERGLQVGEIRVDSRQPSHGGWGGTREEHPGQGGGDAPGSGGGSRGP
jgi:flagellar hook-length control protein FliK